MSYALPPPLGKVSVCTWSLPPSLSGICFPVSSKESACHAGDMDSTLRSGSSPAEGNGNLLQYSCLGNPMDGESWRMTVQGIAKSWT